MKHFGWMIVLIGIALTGLTSADEERVLPSDGE